MLTAIEPDGPIKTITARDADAIHKFISANDGKRNLYFSVNPTRTAMTRKAAKTDIAAIEYLPADLDPKDNELPEAAKVRYLKAIEAHEPACTAIIDSGNGIQGLWRLAERIELAEPATSNDDKGKPVKAFPPETAAVIADVEARTAALMGRLGSVAGTQNIDRILRLPGTTNLPNKKKIKAGRVACPTKLIHFNGATCTLDAFPNNNKVLPATKTMPPGEVSLLGVDDVSNLDANTKTLLSVGDDPERPRDSAKPRYKSRSEALFGAVARLVRADHDDHTIAGLILNPKLKISESVLDKSKPKDYAFKQIAKARATVAASSSFPDLTKDGRPRPTLPNTKVALKLLEVECRYDLFKLRYSVNGHQLESFVGEVSDPMLLRGRELIHERFGFDPPTETVLTAVQTLANHARHHPVRDYLDSLKRDGVERIDHWLTTYGGAEDTPLTRAIGALLLVAAVRRVRQPGCKFDELVVFESDQGTNKSQALQILAVQPEWFSDNLPLGLSARETIEALSGHWIIEVSELQGMRKSEIEKVKAFLSRGTDRARTAYAITVTEARRQCVPIGTTNSEQYLRDLTGNRRIWPVRIEKFDLAALECDRDQLWAEAAAREAGGASIRLPEELWSAAALEQQERLIENPFASVLYQVLRDKDELANDVWVEGKPLNGKLTAEDAWTIVGVRPERRTQQQFENLGGAMKQLGWTRTRLRVGSGGRSYIYVRGDKPYRWITVFAGTDGNPATACLAESTGPEPKF